jgi:UDP-N-acetylglucosamine transferase subunit ALG13
VTGTPARVVVFLGTDHHPFARLVDWVDRWAADHPDIPCFIQHGPAPAPTHAPATDFVGSDELRHRLADADVVVGHAGPGTIMDALAAGRLPIVVARLSRFDEVVDDHQVAFSRLMAEEGRCVVVDDEAGVRAAIDAALASPERYQASFTSEADDAVRRIGELIDGMLA